MLGYSCDVISGAKMVRPRKAPSLRVYRGKYYCADFYLPNGKRSTIGFGTTDERTTGEVYTAFGKWLTLYDEQPHKVLGYKNPYQAIDEIISPSNITTIKDLLDKYEAYLEKLKKPVKHGLEHPDLRFLRRARDFLKPYNDWPLDSFGPDELIAVQKTLLTHEYTRGKKKKRYTRRGINDTIKWIRKIWRWGMGRQLIKPESVQGLEEVRPLKMGSTDAPDNHRRRSVSSEEFQKVVNSVNTVVGEMLQLIWHTGMRPYEVCEMTPFDIIRDDPECWLYIPGREQTPVGKHKTTMYERVKVIPLTMECQKILIPRLKGLKPGEYIFKPEDAVREVQERKRRNRKTPLKWGNRPGTNKKENPKIKPGKYYTNDSLCHACKEGCRQAGVEIFVPYDLRRTMATATRSVLGKEAAKVLLGHAKTDTTEIYLLEEVQEAMKVAKSLATQRRNSSVL
jgi:integrase